jgi:Na+-driven multidrug efflux pump
MGGLVLSIFLLSLGVTFNGSLDTLISQAYGQRELRLCRVYLNRQLYLTTIVFSVLALPLIFTKEMVMGLGQTEETGRLAATYVHIMIPGVLTYSWQSCYSRFLSGQRVTVVPMYANITATAVHVSLVLLLTVQQGMGITGVAIASSTQFFVRYLVTVIYVRRCGKFDDPAIQVAL